MQTNSRPLHPGELLRQVMDERQISEADLVAVGLRPAWVSAFLKRQEELPLDVDHTIYRRLSAATGTAVSVWQKLQREWATYARGREQDMSMKRLEVKGRHLRLTRMN